MRFWDRVEAGRKLAQKLIPAYRGGDGVVYALPRGGVVLGVEIAQALRMPLDLVIARKIGHPRNPEYAIGAVSEGGELVTEEREVSRVDQEWFRNEVVAQRREAQRRRRAYLGDRPARNAAGTIAILVDDGIATGLTMQAAIRELRRQAPVRLVVAVPVAPAETAAELAHQADDVAALDVPQDCLGAVGAYYDYFPRVSDDEVIALMELQYQGSLRNEPERRQRPSA